MQQQQRSASEFNPSQIKIQQQASANLYYLIPCFLTGLLLFICLVVFFANYKDKCSSVLKVIALLLFNQLLESIFQSIGYMGQLSNSMCSLSIIGKASFTVAANFWLIFITRLLYLEKLQPGKYFNIVFFYGKNVLLTYTPSLVVCVFLLVIININQTQSEDHCWRVITNKQFLDYIIYITCFILPNVIAVIVVGIYLHKYFKIERGTRTLFLWFPFISILFSLYYISIKVYMFVSQEDRVDELEIPLIAESLIYMILFIKLIRANLETKSRQNSLEYTIKEDSVSGSFIEDFQPKNVKNSVDSI